MNRGCNLILALAALAAATCCIAQTPSGGTGTVYRWTDEKGIVHYGDSIPPEYAQGERSLLNSRGVEVGRIEGIGNAAAVAQRDRLAEAARRSAQHDQFLLSTYLSAKDIEQLRDERLSQEDAQIKASAAYIDSLGVRLAALQDRAFHFKPYSSDAKARRMPDDLAEELVLVSNESRNQRAALDAKRREQTDMQAQFEADIARYRELTAKQH